MAKYSIEDTTLIALGDAIRGKTSETRMETILVEEVIPAVETVKSPDPYPTRTSGAYQTFTMNGASKIEVNLKCMPPAGQSLYIAEGIANNGIEFDLLTIVKTYTGNYTGTTQTDKFVINGNSITFKMQNITSVDSGYFFTADCVALDANGNSIGGTTVLVEKEVEVKNTMTPAKMAEVIEELPPGPPEEAYTITGNCNYKFAYNGWNWFIEEHGNKIITKDITTVQNMFYSSSKLTSIPFDINVKTAFNVNLSYLFDGCTQLTNISKITGRVDCTNNMFYNCRMLRELKEESIAEFDWDYMDKLTSSYGGSRANMFQSCYSLRKYPNSFLAHGNPACVNSYSIYYSLFNECYVLDEIVDLPIQHRTAKWTSNAFNNTFKNCARINRLTFETNEDGSPIKIDTWSKQAIDLNSYVGYISTNSVTTITGYNSDITKDKQVTDDASYQALKNDPDWFSTNINYSRYNKTSAVETINSLPDLSGGAGSNTIKFKGASGTNTEGGAINTMTEEEIAVATAKGWTVTFA